jgi:hypothetical protein
MKFTCTILKALFVTQAISLGAAKREPGVYNWKGKGHGESSGSGKGKGGSYSAGKGTKGKGGYSSESTSGKGKGGSYPAGKGKGYTPTTKEPTIDCDAILHALKNNTFKSVGAATLLFDDGRGIGSRAIFSKNEVYIDGNDANTDPVAFVSGYCTVLQIFETGSDSAHPLLECQVTVDVEDDAGSITHQGLLEGGVGFFDADTIDHDELIVTGGSKCFEGIVGTAHFDEFSLDQDADDMQLTILLKFDVRVL